jgi:hypothetical protein
MTYLLEVETADNKKAFTEEFFMTLPFVKNVKPFTGSKPAKPRIYQCIDDYRNGVINYPLPVSLEELERLSNFFASEQTPPEETTYEERRKKLDELLDRYPINSSNFKFNRNEANSYG